MYPIVSLCMSNALPRPAVMSEKPTFDNYILPRLQTNIHSQCGCLKVVQYVICLTQNNVTGNIGLTSDLFLKLISNKLLINHNFSGMVIDLGRYQAFKFQL